LVFDFFRSDGFAERRERRFLFPAPDVLDSAFALMPFEVAIVWLDASFALKANGGELVPHGWSGGLFSLRRGK